MVRCQYWLIAYQRTLLCEQVTKMGSRKPRNERALITAEVIKLYLHRNQENAHQNKLLHKNFSLRTAWHTNF
jgi:hypothetical protein